jgi:hypothetical protein
MLCLMFGKKRSECRILLAVSGIASLSGARSAIIQMNTSMQRGTRLSVEGSQIARATAQAAPRLQKRQDSL